MNGGTSQIQAISKNLERLCAEFGCPLLQADGVPLNNNSTGLLTDIRQLAEGLNKRDEEISTLQVSISNLAKGQGIGGG